MIWISDAEPGHCTLDSSYVPYTSEMHAGESVAAKFPRDIKYQMSDLFPDDLLLSDNFECAGQIVVSLPLKERLAKELLGHHLEFLPVTILNHKGRIASTDYFIVHSQDMVDCINIAKSKVQWNPLDKAIIMACKGLVINDAAIPEGVRLFRPVHWGSMTMVDSRLAENLQSAGFTGLCFISAAGFDGIS